MAKSPHRVGFFTWTLLGQQPINQAQLNAAFQICIEMMLASLYGWDQVLMDELTKDVSVQAGPI